jgi:hypothetical protein
VASYHLTLRDAMPFVRRRVAWALGVSLLMIVVGISLGLLWGAGSPTGLTSFGIGIGIAIGLVTNALVDYQRTKEVYEDTEPTELLVAPDQIVFTTDLRQTTIRRAPKVSVVESSDAFLITIGKGAAPVLVPVRHLATEEVEVLRNWIAK